MSQKMIDSFPPVMYKNFVRIGSPIIVPVKAMQWNRHGDHYAVQPLYPNLENTACCYKCKRPRKEHGIIPVLEAQFSSGPTPRVNESPIMCPGSWIVIDMGIFLVVDEHVFSNVFAEVADD